MQKLHRKKRTVKTCLLIKIILPDKADRETALINVVLPQRTNTQEHLAAPYQNERVVFVRNFNNYIK